MYEKRVPLKGSERRLLAGARDVGAVDRTETITVSVYVRPNAAIPLPPLANAEPGAGRRDDAAIAAARNASREDLAAVEAFARQAGLAIVESSAEKRSVRLSGS